MFSKIKEGDIAPIFKEKSYNAGMIDLAKEIGDQRIVLIFSRYFGCPICQLDLEELMERLTEIENKNAKIIYITQSEGETAKEYIENENIQFPVIKSPNTSEKEYSLYRDYGLKMMCLSAMTKVPFKLKEAKKRGIEHGNYEGWEKQCPGQFIIDEEGKIIHAEKGWLDIDKIIEVLEEYS